MALKIESFDEADMVRSAREQETELICGAAADMVAGEFEDRKEEADIDGESNCEKPRVGLGRNRITRLASGVRDQNRVNVYINDKFSFSLDIAQVVDFHLKVGTEVTSARLAELKEASEFGKLYQRTLEWCMMRPHSILETRLYLQRRIYKRELVNRKRAEEEKRPLAEISKQNVELVLERLLEKGHLDDKAFATYYVENRHLRKGISEKRLRTELTQKGIKKEIISQVLEDSPRAEEEEIAKIIAKKHKKYDDKGLLQYLLRQGFNYQVAKTAVEKTSAESSPEYYE